MIDPAKIIQEWISLLKAKLEYNTFDTDNSHNKRTEWHVPGYFSFVRVEIYVARTMYGKFKKFKPSKNGVSQ